jgi:hypothetical protein
MSGKSKKIKETEEIIEIKEKFPPKGKQVMHSLFTTKGDKIKFFAKDNDQLKVGKVYEVKLDYSIFTADDTGIEYPTTKLEKIIKTIEPDSASDVPSGADTASSAASAPQSGPAGVPLSTGASEADLTPMRIFCCGVVQNAMASGDFTPASIDPLTRAAKAAFLNHLEGKELKNETRELKN